VQQVLVDLRVLQVLQEQLVVQDLLDQVDLKAQQAAQDLQGQVGLLDWGEQLAVLVLVDRRGLLALQVLLDLRVPAAHQEQELQDHQELDQVAPLVRAVQQVQDQVAPLVRAVQQVQDQQGRLDQVDRWQLM